MRGTRADSGIEMTAMGPLEFLVVGFPGCGLPDGAGAALERIHGTGRVRTIEAILIIKSESGVVRTEDFTEVAGLATVRSDDELTEVGTNLIDARDVANVSAAMADDSTALALLFEHQRAQDVPSVFQGIGGVVLASTRMPATGEPSRGRGRRTHPPWVKPGGAASSEA